MNINMANGIKIGNLDISAFKVGSTDVDAIYLGDTLLYPTTPSYDVCYAVVEDISSYTDRTYTDVYEKSSDKWYKLNNLNQYEEYGIYGSGRTITYYDGKLTVDDGYEYEWNGSSWVNVGEVSGSSVVEYIETPTSSPYAGIELLTSPSSQSTPMYYEVDCLVKSNQGDNSILGQKSESETVSYQFGFQAYNIPYYDYGGRRLTTNWDAIGGLNNRIKVGFGVNSGDSKVVIKNLDTSTTVQSTTATPRNVTIPLLCNAKYNTNTSGDNYATNGQLRYYEIKIYDNNVLVGDYIPAKNPSTNEYTFYETISQRYCSKIGSGTIAGHEESHYEYPKYYSEKSDPLDNLTFNTMEDALDYAYNNCVYDGMKAIINGDRYYFDSEDENGWVKILSYYKVEDIGIGGTSGWTITGSSTYNPNSSYYDDFSVENSTTTNRTHIAKVTIYGYDHFTYYLRSYGYSNNVYNYVVSTNVDELQSNPTSYISYSSNNAITNTAAFQKSAGSAVNLSNYRRVTYNNLDKTVEHTFYVSFYGRTYSSYYSNATILIPKEQDNENWEQVTFSASSNVASSQKSLYIDGNYSTSSGGTTFFYYRWIVGLPSGSHSSYTDYRSYDYCPNVTSSTYTSVAGQQRQVNFTWDTTTNKSLSFRLVDSSGNTLTPSDIVYYDIVRYNTCNASSTLVSRTFPSNISLKVGGSFYLSNTQNRHYIYGYAAPTTGTTYYVDNYSTTFDIVYTALTRESVSVTYTTYDPNDSETPALNTDITWPYYGGSTSSTTLTSYTVPYTYSYDVSQTSDMFSAASQTYTANQSSRTITFTLYPNNRTFASVAALEAYAYAWEGMKASVNGTNYVYKNGQWVEQPYNQYEYIRTSSAATQYYTFDTNFYPTTANTLEVKFEMTDRSVDWGHICSWYDGTASHGFSFQTVTASYQAIVRTGGDSGTSYRPTIGANNPTVYTLPLSAQSGTYSINGGSPQTIQYNYSTMALPANTGMCFFGKGTTSREKAAVGKIYYVKVYDNNNNLVKHYVPSDYNGTPCFYEIINGEYIMDTYTGSNHGTLTLGPQV